MQSRSTTWKTVQPFLKAFPSPYPHRQRDPSPWHLLEGSENVHPEPCPGLLTSLFITAKNQRQSRWPLNSMNVAHLHSGTLVMQKHTQHK